VSFFERFQAELGTDPEFHQHGYPFLTTTKEDATAFRQNVPRQRSLELEVEGFICAGVSVAMG
jgi:hypothetical protein